jgi:hypothetical protein
MDLVEKINDKTIRENEKNNYVLRLEATAAYISEALTKNAMTFSQNKKKIAR